MANQRKIIISKVDHERLENLLTSEVASVIGQVSNARSLRGELDIAVVVDAEDVPPDVVTVNSTVRLSDSRSSYENTYTLVYPEYAANADVYLSVLAPTGTAILGYRVGDLVEWPVPSGTAQFRIEELVFQPERDGVPM